VQVASTREVEQQVADASIKEEPSRALRRAPGSLERILEEVDLEISGESVDAVLAELVRRLAPEGIHPTSGDLRSYAEEIGAGAYCQ
jgi:hypothetical protein